MIWEPKHWLLPIRTSISRSGGKLYILGLSDGDHGLSDP